MQQGIIIQARTGSKRLPQKMILPFYKEMGILETILIRLIKAKLNVPIILATTHNPKDSCLKDIAKKHGITVFRGNEENVLERFIKAAEAYNIQKIIRICADNPFLDIPALKYQIDDFSSKKGDYWCYCKHDYTPTIKTHYGFWAEGVTLKALNQINALSNEKLYQEHVTNYIYSNPKKFTIHFETIDKEIETTNKIRLTVDTKNDFENAKEIYSELINNNIPIIAKQVIKYVSTRPTWIKIMKNEIKNNIK